MWLYVTILFRDQLGEVHRARQVRWNEHLFLLTGKTPSDKPILSKLEAKYGKHFGPLGSYANAITLGRDAAEIAQAYEEMTGESMPKGAPEKEVECNRRAWTSPRKIVSCLEHVRRAALEGELSRLGFFMDPSFESGRSVHDFAAELGALAADVRAVASDSRFSSACFAVASDDDLDGTAIIRKLRKSAQAPAPGAGKSDKRMVLRTPSAKDLAQIAQQSWRRLQHVELEIGARRFDALAAPLAKLLAPDVTPALETFTVSDWYEHVERDSFVGFFQTQSRSLARLVLFPGVERSLCFGNWTQLHRLAQMLLIELKQPRRAVSILELMAEADPSEAGPFTDLGLAFDDLGQRAKAVKMLEHSLELDASDEAVRYNLANLLRKMGKLDEALEHIELALKASPADPATCHVKAKILDQKGDRRAKTWYRRALDLYRAQARADGGHPATLLQIACVHAGLGEDEAAFEVLHQAISADPLQVDDAKTDGDLARLRRDPRFSKLVAEQPPSV